MPDYQKMYTALFNRVTDAIATLQEAQQLTEELYLGDDDGLRIVSAAPDRPEDQTD